MVEKVSDTKFEFDFSRHGSIIMKYNQLHLNGKDEHIILYKMIMGTCISN